MEKSEDQPVVLITGASRGLGAAIARIAANWGASVVITARNKRALEQVVKEIGGVGGSAFAITGDVSNEADCQRIIQAALREFGRLDALINNSGQIEPIAPLAEADLGEWKQNWLVNLFGAVTLTSLAIPYLRQNQGKVIFISSGAAENVIPGWSAYSASKAALNHLTRILAQEEPAITSISVKPGVVDTEMQTTIREKGKGHMGEKNYARLTGLYEENKLLPPELPARAIAALALGAPKDLSGETVSWDDPRVQAVWRASA